MYKMIEKNKKKIDKKFLCLHSFFLLPFINIICRSDRNQLSFLLLQQFSQLLF